MAKRQLSASKRPRKSSPKTPPAKRAAAAKSPSALTVDAFIDQLDGPHKAQVQALRRIILDASPKITEGIKWNAPSFRTTDDFATMNLRPKDGKEQLWLILHTGAKVNNAAAAKLKMTDPDGLLKWLAKDRALATFDNLADLKARQVPLQRIIREWMQAMEV